MLSPNDVCGKEGRSASTIRPPIQSNRRLLVAARRAMARPATRRHRTRSPASTSAGRPMADHPNYAQFAGIRGELARLFIKHKAELQFTDWTDEQIAERVADITAALIGCGQVAVQRGDTAWLDRHRWFRDAFARMFDDQPAVAFNE
jgi:hypothetical protein